MRYLLSSSCLLFLLACSGSKGGSSPLTAARETASGAGTTALRNVVGSIASSRSAALAAAETTFAAPMVVPTIEERVAALDAALTTLADDPAFAGATLVAVGSDGITFTSRGPIAITPFTRPFTSVPCVVSALTSATAGRCASPLHTQREVLEMFVAPVRSSGAVVGALVALETRESLAEHVRDRVRNSSGALGTAGVCLGFESDFVCADVPEQARRAASNVNAAGGGDAPRVVAEASLGGAVSAIRITNWPSQAAVFVPSNGAGSGSSR